MKRIPLILLTLFLFGTTTAQVKWPAITQTAKPWTRWWWQGSAVDKAGLTAAMVKYEEAGLGGLEITPIYGVKGKEQQFIPFLTPKWMEMLQHTLQEAKRLNLGIDMATGTGWPFGGPWVTDADASKYFAFKKYKLKPGVQLAEPVSYTQEPIARSANPFPLQKNLVLTEPVTANKDLQALALDQVRYAKLLPLISVMAYYDNGEIIDITNKVDAQGKLNWVPAHNAIVYALFQGWHGKMVERAAPGGEGLAIDHFSVAALDHYLGHFDKAFAGYDLTTLRSFFNDSYEVDDARGEANWTPDLFDAFQKKRGYDLRSELPALLAKDSSKRHLMVLYDYRMTISELLLEQFTRPWHQWADAKGKLIRNQSHGSPANILDLYDAIDIPETEGTDILRFKFATSVANVSGKPLASAEAATWLNEHFQSSLSDVKQAIDKYFVGGVNHIFYHGTNYSPQNEPWPGWLFYAAVHFTPANPFWKDFSALNSYVARCQSFLQSGKSDNDVLLYFPFHDRNRQPGRELLHHFDGMEGFHGSKFEEAAKKMLDEGYSFDLISDLQLHKAKVLNGKIHTAGGKYQTILLAGVKYLPLETLDQLIDLVKAGATVLVYEQLPEDVPGYSPYPEFLKRKIAFKEKMKELSSSVLPDTSLSALLKAAQVRQETFKGFQFVRRVYSKGHYYFISSKDAFKGYITFSSKEKQAALFDPMLGRKGIAETKTLSDGRLQVYVDLEAGESCIIQTGTFTGGRFPYTTAVGKAESITGKWQLQFPGGASVSTDLVPWTDACFSGTATYRIRFKKPEGKAAAWELNLGKVEESAEVFLNGKRLATLIGPVYKLVVDLKAENELQVVVTNSMANRIIDLDKQGVEWKKFYNINMPARSPANKGTDGLFTAAGWTPQASGLLGPVTLTPVDHAIAQDSVYLFSYFKDNGEDGLHLAYSMDGYTWKTLKGGRSFLKPTAGKDKLMRDPCIIRGADGKFHMVWTLSWNEQRIGYASSDDLIHWSAQKAIPVMAQEPGTRNCWAPEITYDSAGKVYMIYWASTIPGRFKAGATSGDDQYNHRMYYVTTKDFMTFSPAKLLYDHGFNVIDATIVPNGNAYIMFLKDETRTPPQKNIRISTSKELTGPYSTPSVPITGKYWAEGPAVLKMGEKWLVYFDKYNEHKYGAVESADGKHWMDVSGRVSLPKGLRHGSIFVVSKEEFNKLNQ